MTTSRSKAALGALALALGGGAALAAGQQQTPESLLPPGFGDPVAPAPAPTPTASPDQPPAPGTPPAVVTTQPGVVLPTPTPTATEPPEPVDLSKYELPAYARRSLAQVGTVGTAGGGVAPGAFGATGGRAVETWMRRLDAPVPSRWLSIALRRALLSRIDTPDDVNGADFAAERAWLLLRMGEAGGARAVVQAVDVEDYTPKLLQVAMQAMLANGDPAGLCPLVETARRLSYDRGWRFAQPICTALAGKPAEAKAQFAAARRGIGRTIDTLLAEKVVGAAGQGGAVTIDEAEWGGADRLTAWRYGLAAATGVKLPDTLLAAGAPWVQAWRATQPMQSPAARMIAADYAASQGVLSNLALVDLYGALDGDDDATSAQTALARDLRSAYAEGTQADRLGVMRRLWSEPGASPRARYARLVLTARAATGIAPNAERAEDAPRLIAAMLSAGLDRQAARWQPHVAAGSDGWAMLQLADPRGRLVGAGEVEGYAGGDRRKGQMLLAGLAGLGRMSDGDAQGLARTLEVPVGAQNSWTRAIRAAAARGDGGTVLLLFALGMQTGDWRGVPPAMLYHGCAALRAVGMEGEARMIAAEAIARL